MNKEVKLIAIVEEAVQVAVSIPDLKTYFEALTVIFNSVRDRRELYRVSNDSGNTIYVDCRQGQEQYVIDWLSQWGEPKIIGKSLAYTVELPYDFDFDKYEEEFVVAVD